jgi:hypothetical protein
MGRAGAVSIEVQETVTIADVEVGDDYEVRLSTARKLTKLEPKEARQLAAELVAAADEAVMKFEADFPALVSSVAAHRFDVLPSCRDCLEGKHGACIGSTFVEVADDVAPDEVECVCSKVGHHVLGGAS